VSFNFTKEYGVYSIWHGHSNSPVLFGDLILSVCIQDPVGGGQSYVCAHEKLTGKEKWFVKRDYGAKNEPGDSYTTPLLLTQNGKTEMIVFGANVLDAYDPATGKLLWLSKPFTGNRVISGPTLAGDMIYAVEGMKGPVFAVKAGGEGDVTKSSVKWKVKPGVMPDAASPVVVNGLVFLVNNDGFAFCLDAKDGKEQWKQRFDMQGRPTPLVAGDKVYFLFRNGTTVVVEASREYKMVAESALAEDVIASPAAAGGLLFLRTHRHLWCIGNNLKAKASD